MRAFGWCTLYYYSRYIIYVIYTIFLLKISLYTLTLWSSPNKYLLSVNLNTKWFKKQLVQRISFISLKSACALYWKYSNNTNSTREIMFNLPKWYLKWYLDVSEILRSYICVSCWCKAASGSSFFPGPVMRKWTPRNTFHVKWIGEFQIVLWIS